MNNNNILYLSEVLMINSCIQFLNLTNNNLAIDENNLLYLSDSLLINNSLKKLDLNNNFLGRNQI